MKDYYGMTTLPRVLADKNTSQDISGLEDEVIDFTQELNSKKDEWFPSYNPESGDFEVRKDNPQASDIARRISDAIIRTDRQLKNATSAQKIRGLKKVRSLLILYLKLVGMNELAEAFEK